LSVRHVLTGAAACLICASAAVADMVVNSAAFIPLVHRGRVSSRSKLLGGVVMNPWDSELWNAADWYRVKT